MRFPGCLLGRCSVCSVCWSRRRAHAETIPREAVTKAKPKGNEAAVSNQWVSPRCTKISMRQCHCLRKEKKKNSFIFCFLSLLQQLYSPTCCIARLGWTLYLRLLTYFFHECIVASRGRASRQVGDLLNRKKKREDEGQDRATIEHHRQPPPPIERLEDAKAVRTFSRFFSSSLLFLFLFFSSPLLSQTAVKKIWIHFEQGL
jgi:hypothetical protein